MSKDLSVDIIKLISYIAENNQTGIDSRKVRYLLERFERSLAKSEIEDILLNDLIEGLSEVAANTHCIVKMYCHSFLAKSTNNVVHIEKMLEMCASDEISDPFEINFIRWQCLTLGFINSKLSSSKSKYLLHIAYKKCVDKLKGLLNTNLKFIPYSERSKTCVIAITSQLLTINHGPTKTLLARCRTLEKILGMNVFIINTREHLSLVGKLPFHNILEGTVANDFSNYHVLKYEDCIFEFYQSPVPMPNLDELKRILNKVYDIKPYFIVNIGGNCITADLCSKIVPVVTIGTVPSAIPDTFTQFRTIGRKLKKTDLDMLNNIGVDCESVIESVFTTDFRKQTEKVSRTDLGLPEDKFLIMLVGWRLDYEVDSDFLNMMSQLRDNDICYVFIGRSDQLQKTIEADSRLADICIFLGVKDDLLAIAEICNLYINPKRTGGGSSCVEVMSKGVPVVTMPDGDVGLNAGEQFFVYGYKEMAETIKQYIHDKDFYEIMSKEAVKRADFLQNTDREFKAVIDKMLNSNLFK